MSNLPIQPGDYHLIINDWESKFESEATLFNANGKIEWKGPCLAKGVSGPDWGAVGGDTPPGQYRCGVLTITQPEEPAKFWRAYGKYFIDLIPAIGDYGPEERLGRAGCGIHGGGTGAPDPMASYQVLMPTLGCLRFHNADMETVLLPIYNQTQAAGRNLYVTVNQH